MATIEAVHGESEVELKQPAIDVLNYIKNLDLPELKDPGQAARVYLELHLGRLLGAIVDVHGQTTINSAGYKQLHGTNGNESFVATSYPARQAAEGLIPGSVHVIIFPRGPLSEQLYTIPITIPFDNGRPLVTRNTRPSLHHSVELGEPMPAHEAFAQVQYLAGIMAASLQQN